MYTGGKYLIAFICLLFHTVFFLPAASGEVLDRTVAIVNGELVLYSELRAQMLLMEKMIPEVNTTDPAKKAQIERDVLKQLIRQRLSEMEVKRLKVVVPKSDVDNAIENLMRDNNFTEAQFEAALKQTGQTIEKFREGVKKELERTRLLERVLKSKIVITDQQVDAAMKGGRAEVIAAGQRRVRLGIIFLPVTDAKSEQEAEKTGRDIVEKLKGGADFRKLAIQYSKGPAAAEGGDIGFMSTDDLAGHLSSAVKGLGKDQVSGLVKGQGGYYILKAFDIDVQQQQATAKTDPAVREKVRRELFQKEIDRKFEEWIQNLEAKAFIQINL